MIDKYNYTFNCVTKTVENLNMLLNYGLNSKLRKKGKMPYFSEKMALIKNINILISNKWEEIANEER